MSIMGMRYIDLRNNNYYGFNFNKVNIGDLHFVYFPHFNLLFPLGNDREFELIEEFIFAQLAKETILSSIVTFRGSRNEEYSVLINTGTCSLRCSEFTCRQLKYFELINNERYVNFNRIDNTRNEWSGISNIEEYERLCGLRCSFPTICFDAEEEEESEANTMISDDYYEKHVRGYSHTRPSSSQFIKTQADNEDTKEFYGIELEFSGDKPTCDENMFEILSDLLDEKGLMKTDSSIHGYQSFELVTMPLTANALRDDICHIEKIMNVIERNDFDTDESCGMHVHVNRKFFGASGSQNFKDLIECKILLCLARNEDILKDIAQREHYEYCDFNLLQFVDDSAVSTALKIDKYKQDKSSERYQALNTTNYDTLEFRFMSSTLNYETFIYRFNVIRAICVYVKYHTGEECYRATLKEILAYEREA